MYPATIPNAVTVTSLMFKAFGLTPQQRQSIRAWRYFEGTAYDSEYGTQFAHPFVEWDETEKGRRPAVQPLPKRIVEIGAQFLFGLPPHFQCSTDDLQTFLDDVLQMNRMHEKWLPEARAAAVEGGTVLKFAWTPTNAKRPVSIQTYSPHEVTFQRDEMDADLVLSATINLKFFSPQDDCWYLYREYWDTERLIIYKKLKTEQDGDAGAIGRGFVNGNWPIDRQERNPFGLVPLTLIRNQVRKHDPCGYGDYWDSNVYHLFDDYNLFCWLERHSNQIDGNPILAVLNDQTFDGGYAPGDVLKLTGEGVDAKFLIPGNNIREWIDKSKADTAKQIYNAVGYDDVDPATITNKGNLTRAVWEMVYAKTIKSTAEKQALWGEGGLCVFFENLLEGLALLPDARSKYPALKAIKPADATSFDVQAQWPDLFDITPEERTAVLSDLNVSVASGYLTVDRAVAEAAKVWHIQDVTELLEELSAKHDLLEQQDQAAADMMVNEAANAGKPDNPPKQ